MGHSSGVQLRQHRAARRRWLSAAWSAGAEVSTGRSLGESLLCGEDRLTSDREVKGPGAGGGRGEEGGVILEESHRKGKLEPPRSMPQVFRKTEIRKHSTTETTGSAELRESSEAGGKPV